MAKSRSPTAGRGRGSAGRGPGPAGGGARRAVLAKEEAAVLAGLREAVRADAAAVVDRCWTGLSGSGGPEGAAAGSPPPPAVRRALARYVASLASGSHGAGHERARSALAEALEGAGVTASWQLRGPGLLLDALLPPVERRYREHPADGPRAVAALAKRILLDLQLELAAYYDRRQQHVIERSEQLAAVGELAASIAHEVRNPLAGMKGALQVLYKDLAARPDYREVLDELVAQIERLEGLVRDLLTYARPRPVNLRSFDLHELLDRVLRYFKDGADRVGVTVHRIYGPGTGRLVGDPQQMEQVFLNLVQNAMQSMEGGGTLTVTTTAGPESRIVTFRDTGRGMPPSVRERIFQPFFTTKHRGSGLGLPIVRKIVGSHGGWIDLESAEGAGTTVTVTLPQSEAG